MTFDWTEYRSFADGLLDGSERNECAIRNAISRLYYHALHIALNFSEASIGYSRKNGPGEVGTLLRHLRQNRRDRDANIVRQLQMIRERCDYEDTVATIDKELEAAVSLHQELNVRYGKFGRRIRSS